MSEVEDQRIETWLDRLASSKPADVSGDEKDDMRLKIEEYLTERLQPLDRHLPHRHTEDFWLEVVKIDGTKLWAVPDKLKTPEICLAAILQTPCALSSVPETILTREMVDAATEANPCAVSQNIPDDIMTPGFCQKLCDRNDEVFRSLPADKKPYSLCLDVVRRNG